MSGRISVSDEELQNIINSLEEAANDYTTNLSKLTDLINQITSGDIKGDVADDFKAKYEAKRDTFNELKKTIEEAQSYMQDEKKEFNRAVSDTKAGMR